jgi:uncharacterized protein (DUF2062 family)
MDSFSMHRRPRRSWRFFVGLSVLGLLIVASASHAAAHFSSGSNSSATPFMQ